MRSVGGACGIFWRNQLWLRQIELSAPPDHKAVWYQTLHERMACRCSTKTIYSASRNRRASSFLRHWAFVIGHLRQHVGGAARVINDVVRLEQSGNHHHALCPGVDHAL